MKVQANKVKVSTPICEIGFRPALVGEGRDRRRTVHPVAGRDC
jgi:hypothetical protein